MHSVRSYNEVRLGPLAGGLQHSRPAANTRGDGSGAALPAAVAQKYSRCRWSRPGAPQLVAYYRLQSVSLRGCCFDKLLANQTGFSIEPRHKNPDALEGVSSLDL